MALEIPGILKMNALSDVMLKDAHPPPEASGERTARAEAPAAGSVGREELEAQIKMLEKTFLAFNHRVKLSINEDINQLVIKVLDSETDTVIKEIPPAEIQHMIARIKETIGLLVDEKI